MAEIPEGSTVDVIQPGFIQDIFVMEGVPGTDGTNGTNGTSFLGAAGAPAGGLGAVGDWYLNTSNGDVYEKTGASTWTLRFNSTGPQGDPGTGDVDGPASSTTDNVALYADTTGKLLKDGGTVTSQVTAASESVAGKAEIATQAETNTGTDDARFVTPLKFQTRMAAFAQPLDTDLTAIAALVSAADKLAYATGAGTWSLTDLTSFIRTLLDDANAAAARATLGAAANILGGAEVKAVASGTSGTVTLDCSAASCFSLAPTGNVTTLTLSNPPASGTACTITLKVVQGATPRTIATPSGGIFLGAATPTQAANKTCIFTYYTDDGGTVWHCTAAVQV